MLVDKKVLVFGATGNIRGAAARELLERGWHVRAVTRSPDSGKAQATFVAVDGKKPFRLPLPLGLFQRMAGEEFVKMWRWLGEMVQEQSHQALMQALEDSQRINANMLDLHSWLKMNRNGNQTSSIN